MEIAALGLKVESHEPERAADALDRLSTSADRAEKSSGRFGDRATDAGRKAKTANESASKSAERVAASYGKVNAALVTAAKRMLAFGAATVGIAATSRTLATFEESMAAVSAITRATTDDLAGLRDLAKEIGATTEFSASQAADGIKFLGMAGFDAKQTIAAFGDVVDLATAAQMDLARAADISSNIMSAFGIAANDAAKATDVIAAVTARANTDVSQLGEAMKMVGPVAAAMGVSVNDAAAAVGALSDAGIQGSQAGTGLRRILSTLAGPTKQASDAIKRLGINLEDIDPTTTDIVEIVRQLSDAGLSAADAFTIFGDRGAPAVLALIELLPKLEDLTGELSNVEGEAKRMADVMRDNLMGDFRSLQAAIESVIIALGEAGLIAIMRGALQGLAALIRKFSEAIDFVSRLASSVGSMLAPAFDVISPILQKVAEHADIAVAAIAGFYAPAVLAGIALLTKALAVGLVNAIRAVTAAMMANPIGLIVAGLTAAGYAVYKFRDQIQDAIGVDVIQVARTAANTIVNSFVAAFEDVKFVWNNFGDIMGAAFIGGVNAAIRAINSLVASALAGINSLIDAVNNIPGVNIGRVGGGLALRELENSFAARLAKENEAHQKKIAEILSRDMFVGFDQRKMLDAIEASLAEQDYTTGIDRTLADSGGGGIGGDGGGGGTGGGGIGGDGGGGGTGGGSKAETLKFNDDYIQQLRERIELIGAETEYEKLLARIRSESIQFSSSRIEQEALAYAQMLDFLEESQRKANDLTQIMNNLFPEEAIVDRFIEQMDVLNFALEEGMITAERYNEAMIRLAEDASEKLTEINGTFWEKYLQAAEENLMSFDELAASVIEGFSRRFGDAFERVIFDSESLSDAFRNLAQGMARSIVNAIGQMIAQWLAYQAVQMVVGKSTQASAAATLLANANATSLQAGLAAYASTAAIPIVGPLMAPAAMAAAIGATAPIAAAVGTTALAGIAHDGIDAIPETGTWLLEKGERVTTAQTSARLDNTLARIESGMSGEQQPVQVIVNNNATGTQVRTEEYTDEERRSVIEIIVEDISSDGQVAGAMSQKWGLEPQGV